MAKNTLLTIPADGISTPQGLGRDVGIVEFDWLWELDRKLNELALDAIIALVSAALIAESLRFIVGMAG